MKTNCIMCNKEMENWDDVVVDSYDGSSIADVALSTSEEAVQKVKQSAIISISTI